MKKLFLIVITLLLTSCMSIPTVSRKELDAAYVKKTVAEAQLQALEEKHAKDLQENLTKLSDTKGKVIEGQEFQLQAGADALYSIQQAFLRPYSVGIMEYGKARSLEGFTAMGKPPTVKEIVEGAVRMQNYITAYEKNVAEDIAKLKKEHEDMVRENGILVAQTEAAKKEVELAKKENVEIQAKYIADTTIVHKELDKANNDVIEKEKQRADAEKKRADSQAARERLKKQLMLWCGIAAALCVVGLIYSPVGKQGLGIMAAIFGGAAAAIPFIEPWMVFVAIGIGAAMVTGYILYKHHISEKTNTNLINAIEDAKQKPNSTVDDVLNHIGEWNTVYVKDKAGNVVTKVDNSVEKYIESKLMESGRLVVDKPTTPPSVSAS